MGKLAGKRVLVIASGGIAVYKTPDLVRRLKRDGALVRVSMTRSAQDFVRPLTFQAVSGEPVHLDLLDPAAEAAMGHIELARWADAIVAAPATANFLARLRHGFADDLPSTVCLASTAPILLAPAMNHQMWLNPITRENIAALGKHGFRFVGPAEGDQACGEVGPGRMADPEDIVAAVAAVFGPSELEGTCVVVSAGPTREAIDPVRYISNRSSGKMGYAVAAAAVAAGARVILVSGPTSLACPLGVECRQTTSAEEMYDAVMDCIASADIFISAAAVADYRVAHPAGQKRKKKDAALNLTLAPTRDILQAVTARENAPFTVGFAAETENLIEHAKEKLRRKSLDMIAANQVGAPGTGFDGDENELHVLWETGETRLDRAPKTKIASQLIALVADRYRTNNQS